MATLPGHNLFSSLPSAAPPSSSESSPANDQPPIPIPKYPPKPKHLRYQNPRFPPQPKQPLQSQNPRFPPQNPRFPPQPDQSHRHRHPSFRIPHRRTKYYKPINGESEIPSPDGERSILIGESGVSYLLPGAPFEFQFSYSETPKAKPLAMREPAFLPFAPQSMPRPWTGKAPLKSKREKEEKKNRKIPLFDSFNPPPPGKKGVKYVEMPGPYKLGRFPQEAKGREEILGEPLSKAEIKVLIQPHLSSNRQVNLGRDGLTHNMLELVHTHWKRRRVCKVKCKGVPTVDMDNVCKHLEERTGGKIIHRVGGVVYLFRGRNYNAGTRPVYPLMLWKPATPVYPKLIQVAPEGLTKEEANDLRKKGKTLKPICKLAKNGVYTSLVMDVRHAFERSILVKVDCRGLDPSDYKKIGAKLKELVPCVLLSFDDEQILMWRGHEWKSTYPSTPAPTVPCLSATDANALDSSGASNNDACLKNNIKTTISSPRMMSLWRRAIESSKALFLKEEEVEELNPETLLEKVEEFDREMQATEHSYPATVISSTKPDAFFIGSYDKADDGDGGSSSMDEEDDYEDDDDDFYDDGADQFESSDPHVPLGSLPIDRLTERLKER